jgi:hypothetical protein
MPGTDPVKAVEFYTRDVAAASKFLEEAYEQDDQRLVKLAKKQLRDAETALGAWELKAKVAA